MSQPLPIRNAFDVAKAALAPSLPRDSWYIIAATVLLSARGSQYYGQLYQYALEDLGPNASSKDRQRLTTRMLEVTTKAWTLTGAPSVISAWYAMRPVIKAEDVVHNQRRQNIAANPDFRAERAKAWFKQVFNEEEEGIFSGFAGYPEFEWTLKDVIYGSFLSDLSILGLIENEMLVLACVAGQSAGSPVLSHYRGMRRVGTSAVEARSIGEVIHAIAHGLGYDTSEWHTAEEVESYFDPRV